MLIGDSEMIVLYILKPGKLVYSFRGQLLWRQELNLHFTFQLLDPANLLLDIHPKEIADIQTTNWVQGWSL